MTLKISSCSSTSNKKLNQVSMPKAVDQSVEDECIPDNLKHFSDYFLNNDKFELTDSFCNNYYPMSGQHHDSTGYYFSGYLIKPASLEVEFGIGLYTLDKPENKTTFFDFFKNSGAVKAPMIFIEEDVLIYSISTSKHRNKNELIKFFEQREQKISMNFPKSNILRINI